MAKFDPNRVLPGTIELVRDANGNYTSKVVGLQTINSLSLPEISDTAAVTKIDTDTKTATEITGDTLQSQTQQAFKTFDRDDDNQFTTEKMLTSAKDISKNLRDFNPDTASEQFARQAILPGTEDKVSIKDPTESVFGRSTLEDEQRERQTTLPDLSIKQTTLPDLSIKQTEDMSKVPSRNDLSKGQLRQLNRTGRVTVNGVVYTRGDINQATIDRGTQLPEEGEFATENTRDLPMAKDSLGIQGTPQDIERRQQRQLGMTDEERRQEFQLGSLGISADISKTKAAKEADFASGTITPRVPDAIIEGQPSLPAKRTFIESVNTALKGVGEAAQFISPIMGVVQAIGAPVNESASTTAFNKGEFNIVTSPGSMQGRIVGRDGKYDPANNLFHGMNRTSKFGNLEKAGQKRIDRINKTLSKKNLNSRTREVLEKRRNDFEIELDNYRRDKNDHNIKEYNKNKKNTPMNQLNPNEQRNVSETGNAEGNTSSKIVCTMMNQSYGFGSFRNKIWMKFHKDLSPEYQKGYHRLFLPLVRIAKTNKIIKNILEHIAVHSTIDMRQSMRGKKHLLGRVYRKILLPICYWAGKK